jgi:hypothetical protein
MAQQGRVARRLKAMAGCLDLRAMASSSADGYTTAAGCQTHICMFARLALPQAPANVHRALPQRWGGGAKRHRAACGRGSSWRVRSARSRASRGVVRAADRQTVAQGVQLRALRSSRRTSSRCPSCTSAARTTSTSTGTARSKACPKQSLRAWAACGTAARGQSATSPSRRVCRRLWSAVQGMHPSQTTQTPTTSWSAHSPSTSRCRLAFHAHVGSHSTARQAEQSLAEA